MAKRSKDSFSKVSLFITTIVILIGAFVITSSLNNHNNEAGVLGTESVQATTPAPSKTPCDNNVEYFNVRGYCGPAGGRGGFSYGYVTCKNGATLTLPYPTGSCPSVQSRYEQAAKFCLSKCRMTPTPTPHNMPTPHRKPTPKP